MTWCKVWTFLYCCTFPLAPSFYFFLQCLLLGKANRVDSSARAGLLAGVMSCDVLCVSTPSQFATDWRILATKSFKCSWLCEHGGEQLLGFHVHFKKGLQPTATGGQLCSWWALDINGLILPRCDGAEVWSPKMSGCSLIEGGNIFKMKLYSTLWLCQDFGGRYRLGFFFMVTDFPD